MSKITETSFGMKFSHEVKDEKGNVVMENGKPKMKEDDKRTEVKFSLDFSKLSEDEMRVYAAREVTRIINGEVRDGKRKVEDIQGKTIVVQKYEAGERGAKKMTEEMMIQKLAETHGISVEDITKLLQKQKGAVK